MCELAEKVLQRLHAAGVTLATAESCTGGWLGKLLTDIPGSSGSYLGGVISYTDGVKAKLLGVDRALLETVGAVSEPVARQMAQGARKAVGTDYGVGVTGLAGPGGDGSGKPVGLVFVAVSCPDGCVCRELHLPGDREAVRRQSCETALKMLLAAIR